LAVCAGFQSLGWSYLCSDGTVLDGPGIFNVRTFAGERRIVGPAFGQLQVPQPLVRDSVVGFENHAGRTFLGPDEDSLAVLERGSGNNGEDGGEGCLGLPNAHGFGGLRIGTYLHGPLLPRNPHLADLLLSHAMATGGRPFELPPIDDRMEWRAHDSFVAQALRPASDTHEPAALQSIKRSRKAVGRLIDRVTAHAPR
jgi:CobQ-like glutamine amidotransferase family enzyme